MRKLNVGVVDLVAKAPTDRLWARVMNPNFASIMPQVVARWCEQEGHEVTYVCYTGFEDLVAELPETIDIVFITAFTQAGQLAYALSSLFRSRGAVTVLGGPHARAYPQDAQKYFDYVVGFADRKLVSDILQDCGPHRPLGAYLSNDSQPDTLPGLRERWKFLEPTLRKAPLLKMVPMIGSLGCPYTCSFCVDSTVPYQPLDTEELKADLRFLLTKFRRPLVGWHDPNFGIRFDYYMDAIEDAVPPGRIGFVAESSLSILSEPHLKRLERNGFRAILPGIESWFDVGNKSKTGRCEGLDKVEKVADHINMVARYIPYVQGNFVFGLDADEGPEPFELTKRFQRLAPSIFPGFSLLTSFGQAAPLNARYRETNRVLRFPFHLLNNNHAMNVRPKNYSWPEFYDRVIDITEHSFSKRSIFRRLAANSGTLNRAVNAVRALSSEGAGRLRYYKDLRHRLDTDTQLRSFYEQESDEIPQFFVDRIKGDLGPLWDWLPEGALDHDPYLDARTAPVGPTIPSRTDPLRVVTARARD